MDHPVPGDQALRHAVMTAARQHGRHRQLVAAIWPSFEAHLTDAENDHSILDRYPNELVEEMCSYLSDGALEHVSGGGRTDVAHCADRELGRRQGGAPTRPPPFDPMTYTSADRILSESCSRGHRIDVPLAERIVSFVDGDFDEEQAVRVSACLSSRLIDPDAAGILFARSVLWLKAEFVDANLIDTSVLDMWAAAADADDIVSLARTVRHSKHLRSALEIAATRPATWTPRKWTDTRELLMLPALSSPLRAMLLQMTTRLMLFELLEPANRAGLNRAERDLAVEVILTGDDDENRILEMERLVFGYTGELSEHQLQVATAIAPLYKAQAKYLHTMTLENKASSVQLAILAELLVCRVRTVAEFQTVLTFVVDGMDIDMAYEAARLLN